MTNSMQLEDMTWKTKCCSDKKSAGAKRVLLFDFNLQVVAVAAGFDTRAYRFAPQDGSVSFFEVRLSQIQVYVATLTSLAWCLVQCFDALLFLRLFF